MAIQVKTVQKKMVTVVRRIPKIRGVRVRRVMLTTMIEVCRVKKVAHISTQGSFTHIPLVGGEMMVMWMMRVRGTGVKVRVREGMIPIECLCES